MLNELLGNLLEDIKSRCTKKRFVANCTEQEFTAIIDCQDALVSLKKKSEAFVEQVLKDREIIEQRRQEVWRAIEARLSLPRTAAAQHRQN